MAGNDANSKQRLIAIAAVAILILLAGNAFLLYNSYQKDSVIAEQTQGLDEAEKLKVELEKQYYEALSELEEMRGSNEELNSLIEKQKSELEDQKNKVSRLIRNGKDLKSARAEIKNMNAQLDNYVTEINNLKAQNEQLANQNVALNSTNTALQENLSTARTMNEELATEKATLASEKENLQKNNQALSAKVDIASVVKVGEVNVTGFKSKSNGKAVKKKYAKNIDHLKVCFNTMENQVTEPGNESFFVRIINPLGETLAVETLGSGVMKSGATGEQIRYTQVKELDYNRDEQTLCMIWQPNIPFTKGAYEVEVYNKGHMSGKGGFTLK